MTVTTLIPGVVPTAPARIPAAAHDLLASAARGLSTAALADDPAERYAAAHLAALRAASAILAARAKPARARIRNVWVVLPEVAPELVEWAAFFAAGAGKRAAAQAGLRHAVSSREADDLLRDVEQFLEVVVTGLGLGHQMGLSDDNADHIGRVDRGDQARVLAAGTRR